MQEQEKQTAKGRDLYEWVQSLVGSVLVVVAIFTFVIRMMGVDGHSMLNTLQHGDRLLVVNSMLYHDYKYGDIVILRKNGVFDDDPIVKRVIAVEGQTVDIDFAEGIVYVDGEALEDYYIREPTYIAVGTLMDKGTEEPFLDKDGNEVTARTPFEPEAPSGTVEVTFEFDTEGLAEGDELVVFEKVLDSAGNVVATHEDIDSAEQSVVVDNPDTPEVPEEPYAKTGADAPDATGYAVAAGIALAAAAGAGGVLAYRKRKTAGASKDAAAEEPAEEPEE